MKFSALIIASGRSRQPGRQPSGVTPLILRQFSQLCALDPVEIFISGRVDMDYSVLGCPVLVDRSPRAGPLAGIERGLAAASSSMLLVLSAEMPRMESSFLVKLAERCGDSLGALPVRRGRVEPLAAFYPTSSREIAMRHMHPQRCAACAFAETCVIEKLVAAYPVSLTEEHYFMNWNSPADSVAGCECAFCSCEANR